MAIPAVETVIRLGDMPKPVKNTLPDYKALEDRLEARIRRHFGLSGDTHGKEIAEIDLRMLVTEAKHFGLPWWDWYNVEPYRLTIKPWDWQRSKDEFMRAYSMWS